MQISSFLIDINEDLHDKILAALGGPVIGDVALDGAFSWAVAMCVGPLGDALVGVADALVGTDVISSACRRAFRENVGNRDARRR